MEHVMARRSSNIEDSIGTGNHASRKNKHPTRSRGREAGTGACEISPALRTIEKTQNIKKTDIVTAYATSRGKRRNANGR